MAAQPAETTQATPEGAPPAKAGKGVMLGALAGGLVVGALLGAFVVAPRFTRVAEAKEAPGAEGKAKEKEKGGEAAKSVKLENIIVNPAGSQGTRFVMTTVVYEVPAADEPRLRENEVKVRDAVVDALSALTLDGFTAADSRPRLKATLLQVVRPFVGESTHVAVYVPQFVIQ